MFTGIIETLGEVIGLDATATNLNITIRSNITPELKIDQSVAHNGVCLTVVAVEGDQYTVTAIEEKLQKTNLNNLKIGDQVNLERAMILGSRLDGHIVQGHVDQTGTCTRVTEKDGSWFFSYTYEHTRFNSYKEGTIVNLEFDVIGKYVAKLMSSANPSQG